MLRAKVQILIAPLQFPDRLKAVVLDRLDHLGIHWPRIAGHAKSAIRGVPPRPPGDLRQLLRVKCAHPAPVKFGRSGKRDMADIKVQPHADCIGRHQIIDVPVLIERHLSVAGTRAKRAHHHGATALLPPDQLGNGIYILNRKSHNGAAGRHSAYLFRTSVGQSRESVPFDELHSGHQSGNRRAHGIRAQKQRLKQSARAQQARGKDVAAFGIGAKLNLVHRQKIRANLQRHRFDGADPIGHTVGHNTFFAGDQRHHRGPAQGYNAVIHLARQQP